MSTTIQILKNARKVADYAAFEGVLSEEFRRRQSYDHMGAILADSILQAGLNYSSVVKPRIETIITSFPDIDSVSRLVEVVKSKQTGSFLNWRHPEKIVRFEGLVTYLHECRVEVVGELRDSLVDDEFCSELLQLKGIGPKTVDYMSCLVGIDSIAVDRHVRAFASRVGVKRDGYHFLREVFCCAADLLSLSRRDFDAWVWRRESAKESFQLALPLM